ncbi:MAG: pyruvate kinase, partial [Acidimicrobiia bacterium]
MDRHTKIIATLGPAVRSPEGVRALVRAGMNVARLNFSHGDHDTHRLFVQWVRQGAEEEGKVVAILQDIQGPKLRVGSFPGGLARLEAGEEVRVMPGGGEASSGTVTIDHPGLLEDVEPGEEIILADGLIRLLVTGKAADSLQARVLQ